MYMYFRLRLHRGIRYKDTPENNGFTRVHKVSMTMKQFSFKLPRALDAVNNGITTAQAQIWLEVRGQGERPSWRKQPY